MLSNYVVSAENLIQFKIRLEKEWNCKEYKFDRAIISINYNDLLAASVH